MKRLFVVVAGLACLLSAPAQAQDQLYSSGSELQSGGKWYFGPRADDEKETDLDFFLEGNKCEFPTYEKPIPGLACMPVPGTFDTAMAKFSIFYIHCDDGRVLVYLQIDEWLGPCLPGYPAVEPDDILKPLPLSGNPPPKPPEDPPKTEPNTCEQPEQSADWGVTLCIENVMTDILVRWEYCPGGPITTVLVSAKPVTDDGVPRKCENLHFHSVQDFIDFMNGAPRKI